MKSTSVILVLPALFAFVDAASRTHGGKNFLQEAISPSLHPETDKGFNEDYPKDHQPVAKKAFEYPYPIVQDSGDFDKDYVKDENSDGGEWKAQFDYDKLRTGIGEQKEKMKDAAKEAEEAQKKLDDAKKAHAEAQAASEKAEEEAKGATQAHDDADKKVQDLIGEAATGNGTDGAGGAGGDGAGAGGADGVNGTGNGTAVGGKVGEGVNNVENRVDTLKDCQEQLAKARSDLEKAIADKKAKEEAAKLKSKQDAADKVSKENQEFEDGKAKDVGEKEKNLEKANADAAAADMDEEELEKARAAADAATAKVKELEKRLALEESEAAKADEDYNTQTKELEQTEKDIEKAAENLRKFRGADAGGGVYSTPTKKKKSGSVTSVLSGGVILSVFCAIAA